MVNFFESEGLILCTMGDLFGVSSSSTGEIISDNGTIIKEGNTYNYTGGNKIIANYQPGEQINLASDFAGIDLNGNNFYFKSSSGSLEIQTARDKVITYSYVASGGGLIDGRVLGAFEIIIGGDNADNEIYARNGIDVIQNAGDNDLINLLVVMPEQFSGLDVNESAVSLSFVDGGNLRVGYKFGNEIYACNQSTGEWYTK